MASRPPKLESDIKQHSWRKRARPCLGRRFFTGGCVFPERFVPRPCCQRSRDSINPETVWLRTRQDAVSRYVSSHTRFQICFVENKSLSKSDPISPLYRVNS